MKRVNYLHDKVADPDNLRLASWKAAKGKRHAREIVAYGLHLDANLARLREQILSGKVVVGRYRFFKVFDPKERQICASAFPEQVLHHALMNQCDAHFERRQIFDSYASRRNKGTYAALARAERFHRSDHWYLKLDVRKFFESIHHDVLKAQLRRMFKDWRLMDIFDKIIDSYAAQPLRGLPIGNLCSQYFANHYLCDLDHIIKEQLRIPGYVRYMDDLVLWHSDKAVLEKAREVVSDYVQTGLLCDLKPPELNRTRHGLSFLGYRIFPHQTLLSPRSKRRFVRKMGLLDERYHSGEWSEATCQRHVLPLLAFARHAQSHYFRKNLMQKQGHSP